MKKLIAFFGAAAVLSGSASIALADMSMNKMAMSKLSVAAKFAPNPPKQGAETIVVSLKDAMGKAVKGASVKVSSNMPAMSMGGPTVTAKDNGDGTYAAKINLNFATKWTFDVMAAAGKSKGVTHLSADVK